MDITSSCGYGSRSTKKGRAFRPDLPVHRSVKTPCAPSNPPESRPVSWMYLTSAFLTAPLSLFPPRLPQLTRPVRAHVGRRLRKKKPPKVWRLGGGKFFGSIAVWATKNTLQKERSQCQAQNVRPNGSGFLELSENRPVYHHRTLRPKGRTSEW